MIRGCLCAWHDPKPRLVDYQKAGLACSVHLFHLVLVASVSLLTGEEVLAVLVKSKVCDNAVARVNGDFSLLSVHLLLHEFLNVDAPSAAVNFSDFAFTVLVGSANDLDGVSISDGDGPGLVLGGKLLAQLSRHHSPTLGGGSSEVCLTRLSTLAGNGCKEEKRSMR